MCRDCLVTVRPERGRTCLETGAFVLNYAGCHACKQRSSIKSVSREVSEDEQDGGEYEETITFHHACSACDHHIAEHFHQFTVVHPPHNPGLVQQEYLMDCVLCGRAADTSHTVSDVAAHAHQQQPHVVSQSHGSHGMPAAMSQEQHATMRQMIGRMEIVSAVHVQHVTVLSSPSSQPVDVADDEWT